MSDKERIRYLGGNEQWIGEFIWVYQAILGLLCRECRKPHIVITSGTNHFVNQVLETHKETARDIGVISAIKGSKSNKNS
jgi:hypothetical protein